MFNLYIISNGGLPLFIYPKEQNVEASDGKNTLFAGILSALLKLLVEVEIGEVEQLITKSNTIYIHSSNIYSIICILKREHGIDESDIYTLLRSTMDEISLLTLDREQFSLITPNLEILFENAFNRLVKQWERETASSTISKLMQQSLW
ncbi:MAG: hypothetical protein GPJ54_08565 [Candidatus Heimdallarchaeota archaeon]|nr:hypothetical protein [Candidatus Heimdallarchaeota archaeon]